MDKQTADLFHDSIQNRNEQSNKQKCIMGGATWWCGIKGMASILGGAIGMGRFDLKEENGDGDDNDGFWVSV